MLSQQVFSDANMNSKEVADASSPLSSIPDDLMQESPTAVEQTRQAKGQVSNSSQGLDDDHVHLSDDRDSHDGTFSGALQTGMQTPVAQRSVSLQAPGEQGFAQSDIDAAIAASLSGQRDLDAVKRVHDDDAGPEDHDHPSKKASRNLSGAAKANAARRRVMLYTSHKSPLTKVNLTKLLRLPEAWRALSFEQQKELAAMLPGQPDIGGTGAHDSTNVLTDALMNNDALRTDVREWHESLAAGMEDPDWREEAAEAMEKRARGDLGSGKWWEGTETKQEGESGTADEAAKPWWSDPDLRLEPAQG